MLMLSVHLFKTNIQVMVFLQEELVMEFRALKSMEWIFLLFIMQLKKEDKW